MKGFTFKCEGCGGTFYELTEKFRPTPPMRGDYVALLPAYGPEGNNWYDFPHTEFTVGDGVMCVQCGEPIRMSYVARLVSPNTEEEKSLCAEPILEDELHKVVFRMMSEGKTQVDIAKACQISVYRVRQIQNGELGK